MLLIRAPLFVVKKWIETFIYELSHSQPIVAFFSDHL